MNTHQSQQGAILLPIAIVIFIASLIAASWITFRLWQSGFELPFINNKTASSSPTPSQTADVLSSELIIDSNLENQRPELTKKLLIPMRQYYATRSEQLGIINVEKTEDSDHNTRVTINLTDGSEQKSVTFYYDSVEKNDKPTYPTWTPGMLEDAN